MAWAEARRHYDQQVADQQRSLARRAERRAGAARLGGSSTPTRTAPTRRSGGTADPLSPKARRTEACEYGEQMGGGLEE